MKLKDLLIMCWQNLYRRKLRTILTVIGVVIGTCSIVVMVSLGVGLKDYFDKDMENYADMTAITVSNPEQGNTEKKEVLTDRKIEEFKKMEHVEIVSPMMNVGEYVQVSSDQYIYNGEVVAMDLAAMKAFGYEADEGTIQKSPGQDALYIGHYTPWQFMDPNVSIPQEYEIDDEGEYTSPPPVTVMGSLFSIAALKNSVDGDEAEGGGENPRGSGISSEEGSPVIIKSTGTPVPLQCQGWLKNDYSREGASFGMCISLELGQRLKSEYHMLNGVMNTGNQYDAVKIKVDDYENVEAVEEAIKAEGFITDSAREFRDAMAKAAGIIQLVFGGIGAISLLVAAIGISNTMVMSIYERTREIGVMKVLGCRLKDIRMMFLFEAGGIGLLGGIVGVIFSYMISFVINAIINMMSAGEVTRISVIPIWLILVGIIFSVSIGLIAGFSPANRAVKISPLSAIRQD